MPDLIFFPFCEKVLEKYRDDKRVMIISGDIFQFGKNRALDSYYFPLYLHSWRCATWKRARTNYDVDMKIGLEICDSGYLNNILSEKKAVEYWKSIFNSAYNGLINTWDY